MDVIEVRTSEEQKRDGKAGITYCIEGKNGERIEFPVPFYDLKFYFVGRSEFADQIIESKCWYSKLSVQSKAEIIEGHRKFHGK